MQRHRIPNDLKKLVAYVERMEKEKFDDKKIQSLQEQYHYFIGIVLLCFFLSGFYETIFYF